MKSFNKAYNVQDDYHTPPMLVNLLLPYIKDYFESRDSRGIHTIYCPFDTEDSEYVRILQKAGYKVIYGSIETGQDFFEKPIPPEAELVISNPPFSKKLEVMRKCVNARVPFVLLMNMMAVNYQEIGLFFASLHKGEKIQFIIPDKKVSFNGKTSSFCSGYVCYNFIKQTVFVHLSHNNTGKNYEPAYYYKKARQDKNEV